MKKTAIHNGLRQSAFTLMEVLIATTVMAVILAAVATLASAMSNVDRETKNMSEQQAQIRYTTMRLTEFIRNASLIVPVTDPRIGFCVWTDTDEDGLPDGTELTYIEIDIDLASTGSSVLGGGKRLSSVGQSAIEILEFTALADAFWISAIEDGSARSCSLSNGTSRYTTVIPECSDAEVFIDDDRKFASLVFTVNESGVDRQYQISGTRRCSAEYALDSTGDLKDPYSDDDDE